jgi:TonB family protein
MKSSILVLSLFSSYLLANDTIVSSAELIESVIPAKAVKRQAPTYPLSAARNGNEGWVKYSFVIDKNGRVIDPVVEDSSGIRAFEKAGLKALRKWQYTPAKRDGETIEQCLNNVQLDYKLDNGTKGGRRRFVKEYKDAQEALDTDDLVLTESLISKMEEGKIWNSYEDAWFWMLKAEFAKKQGDEVAQLASISRVVSSGQSDRYIGEDYFVYMLQQKFLLEVRASRYVNALSTFERINQRPDSDKTVEQLEVYANKVKQYLAEQDYILVKGQIDEDGDWWHSLSRNRFSFTNISGNLDSVELRCANKREKYTFAIDSQWNIPQSWGRCRVMVVGENKANFNLVEIRQDVEV